MTRQAIRGARKSGSHMAESALRNHSPVSINFEIPGILVWFHAPRLATPVQLLWPFRWRPIGRSSVCG